MIQNVNLFHEHVSFQGFLSMAKQIHESKHLVFCFIQCFLTSMTKCDKEFFCQKESGIKTFIILLVLVGLLVL